MSEIVPKFETAQDRIRKRKRLEDAQNECATRQPVNKIADNMELSTKQGKFYLHLGLEDTLALDKSPGNHWLILKWLCIWLALFSFNVFNIYYALFCNTKNRDIKISINID